MPRYDFRCQECGRLQTNVTVPAEQRVFPCSCGRTAERLFPVSAILGYQPFQEHYDEALGCDIHSAAEKRRILKDKGLIEAGDPVHGARNFDRHAPEHIGQKPLRGIPYSNFRPQTPVHIGIEEGGRTHWLKESEVKTL